MPLAPLVSKLVRRARWAGFLEVAAPTAFWAALVVAPLVLLARWQGWVGEAGWIVPALAAGVPLAIGVVRGLAAARRSPWTREAAVAWLDRATGGSGALVTGDERPDPRWGERLETLLDEARRDRRLTLPSVRGDRPALFVGAAVLVVFLASAAKLPEPFVPSTEMFLPWIERLAQRLDALEQLELDEDLAAQLAERLDDLRARVEEADPESLYEALDRLGERLDREAEKLVDSQERIEAELASALAAAERAAAGLAGDTEALESLSAALAEARGRGWLNEETLRGMGDRLSRLERGEFDADAAAALGEDVRSRVAERFGELARSGAFDPKKLRELAERACEREPGGT